MEDVVKFMKKLFSLSLKFNPRSRKQENSNSLQNFAILRHLERQVDNRVVGDLQEGYPEVTFIPFLWWLSTVTFPTSVCALDWPGLWVKILIINFVRLIGRDTSPKLYILQNMENPSLRRPPMRVSSGHAMTSSKSWEAWSTVLGTGQWQTTLGGGKLIKGHDDPVILLLCWILFHLPCTYQQLEVCSRKETQNMTVFSVFHPRYIYRVFLDTCNY